MFTKPIPFVLAFCLTLTLPRAELEYNSNDTSATPGTMKPKPRIDAGSEAAATAELGGGSALTTVGHVMAAGGLTMFLIGSNTQTGGLAFAGNLIYQIGMPLVGVGAGKVNRAAERLNPEYRADYRGWGWYWTAFAMGTAGSIILNNVIARANDAETFEEHERILEEDTGFPFLLILGSSVCGIVSWVKFGKLAGEGKRAAREAGSMRERGQLEILPTLAIMADGSTKPGLHLGYRF